MIRLGIMREKKMEENINKERKEKEKKYDLERGGIGKR